MRGKPGFWEDGEVEAWGPYWNHTEVLRTQAAKWPKVPNPLADMLAQMQVLTFSVFVTF